ncbi:MAG: FadR/GntR family transcriptional regulator [Desulfomonilia bacterium]
MEGRNSLISRIQKSPGIPVRVAQQIIHLIRDGSLKPGDKLPSEHEMTRLFGISRISLREAMKLLEAWGYIDSSHRKGKFIRSALPRVPSPIEDLLTIDQEKIWELLYVRRLLDSEAAALACMRATKKDLERLQRIYDRAFAIGENLVLHRAREGEKLYADFFSTIAESTHNTIFVYLRKSINTILVEAFPYSRKKLSTVDDSSQKIVKQLHAIIRSIQSRNQAASRAATCEHIDYLKETLLKAIEESRGIPA